MSDSLEKLKALQSKLEHKIRQKNTVVSSPSTHVRPGNKKSSQEGDIRSLRKRNLARLKFLYDKLDIEKKAPDFDALFAFKAMNLSGIGLKEDDFGQVREGKYIQIISITYEPDKNGKKRAKNVSLGYFGKAQNLSDELKHDIIEFVLRWRYEKAFHNLEHYENLLARLDRPADSLI
jgi:hypothetical protein